jgi:hypothetical protein
MDIKYPLCVSICEINIQSVSFDEDMDTVSQDVKKGIYPGGSNQSSQSKVAN